MERLTRVSKERQAAGKILKIFWFFEISEDVCIEILLPVCSAVHPGLARMPVNVFISSQTYMFFELNI
jgi:hypothetical protein